MAKQKIRQTAVTTLKMLNDLHTQIGKQSKFSLIKFLENRNFRNHQYKSILINNKIVKNIGGNTNNQNWVWLFMDKTKTPPMTEPTMQLAIKFISDFKALNRHYNENSFEKTKTDEIKVLTENAGTLFEPKEILQNDKWKCVPEVVKVSKEEIENSDFNKIKDTVERLSKSNDDYGREKENEVLERWGQNTQQMKTNFPIQNAVYEHLKGNENEIGKKVLDKCNEGFNPPIVHEVIEPTNVKPQQTKAEPPKIVEKTKSTYKYQLKIADGNLAFQFAFLWGLIKINFVCRGKE